MRIRLCEPQFEAFIPICTIDDSSDIWDNDQIHSLNKKVLLHDRTSGVACPGSTPVLFGSGGVPVGTSRQDRGTPDRTWDRASDRLWGVPPPWIGLGTGFGRGPGAYSCPVDRQIPVVILLYNKSTGQVANKQKTRVAIQNVIYNKAPPVWAQSGSRIYQSLKK